MNDVTDNLERHRYELVTDELVAFSEYTRAENVTTFVHTVVPDALGGRGVGSKLVRGALDHERAAGFKVVANCPFVAEFVRRNAEYAELLLPAEPASS